MKNKILTIGILVIVFIFAGNFYAMGKNNDAGNGNQVQQQTQTTNQGEDSQIQTQNNEQTQGGSPTPTPTPTPTNQTEPVFGVQAQQQEQTQQQQQKQINTEEHRSTVSNFVQSLLQVSDKEKGIGEQVKTVAQEMERIANQQKESENATIGAMEKIQNRSKVKTFFIGTDYKNLGNLRSEMVQTRNRLEQTNRLIEKVQNEGDKTELQNQIKTLEQEQTKIENFVKTQESKFSLFGWFVKLFDKGNQEIQGIKVLSPNGGETWEKGKKVKISWDSEKAVKSVNIRLYIAGDGEGQTFNAAIISDTPNTGKYEWTVQEIYAEVWGVKDLPASDKYLVTVEDSDRNNIYDTSDAVFSIK
jgi:hypothetical protein